MSAVGKYLIYCRRGGFAGFLCRPESHPEINWLTYEIDKAFQFDRIEDAQSKVDSLDKKEEVRPYFDHTNPLEITIMKIESEEKV